MTGEQVMAAIRLSPSTTLSTNRGSDLINQGNSMKNGMTGSNRNGLATVVGRVFAAIVMGFVVQSAPGQANLIKNGDFGNGLTDWKSQGNVTAGMFQAMVTDSGGDAIFYQAVTGGSYAYELRFDVDLGGLSNQAGSELALAPVASQTVTCQ